MIHAICLKLKYRDSGFVSQCRQTGNILVDNMRDGFDLYPYNRTTPSRTYKVKTTRMYVKAGVFGEGGRIVVCGSDHGRIYVFGVGELKPRQVLWHGRSVEAVQVVEVKPPLSQLAD